MGLRMANQRLVRQLQRRVSQGFYGDSAVLIRRVGTGVFDENNTETMQTIEIPLECSFTDQPSMENWREYADIEVIDAEIRFVGNSPIKGDKIALTGRFETLSYSDKTFEVIGIRNRDVFGYVCALKAVSL